MIAPISGQQAAIEFVDAQSINLATKLPRLVSLRSNCLKHLVVVASIKHQDLGLCSTHQESMAVSISIHAHRPWIVLNGWWGWHVDGLNELGAICAPHTQSLFVTVARYYCVSFVVETYAINIICLLLFAAMAAERAQQLVITARRRRAKGQNKSIFAVKHLHMMIVLSPLVCVCAKQFERREKTTKATMEWMSCLLLWDGRTNNFSDTDFSPHPWFREK